MMQLAPCTLCAPFDWTFACKYIFTVPCHAPGLTLDLMYVPGIMQALVLLLRRAQPSSQCKVLPRFCTQAAAALRAVADLLPAAGADADAHHAAERRHAHLHRLRPRHPQPAPRQVEPAGAHVSLYLSTSLQQRLMSTLDIPWTSQPTLGHWAAMNWPCGKRSHACLDGGSPCI